MSIKNAFSLLLRMHKRTVTFRRLLDPGPDIVGTLDVTPSNYFRNLEGASNIIMEGRAFVISKENLLLIPGITSPLRGDRIEDSELGEMTIGQVQEMYDLGGSIMGFKVIIE